MGHLVDYIKHRVYEQNKNFICCVIGPTGSGKSYASLSLAQQIMPTFDIDHVVFTLRDFVKIIQTAPKGTTIVYDEAGVSISSRNWQNLLNKTMNLLLQTFRHRNLVVLFTVPNQEFIDAQTRKLLHALFEMKTLNYKKGYCTIKPKFLQQNPQTGKVYHKYLRVRTETGVVKLSSIKIKKPSKPLIKVYEAKRMKFTTKLNAEILEDLKEEEKKKNPKKLTCKVCNHKWKQQNLSRTPRECPDCRTKRWKTGDRKPKSVEKWTFQETSILNGIVDGQVL